MAGYYDDKEYGPGPYRPGTAQFDTMDLGPGPQRVAQLDTANLGTGPHRAPQFDTMNLGPPVRVQKPPKAKGEKPSAGDGRNAAYHTDSAPPLHGYRGGDGSGSNSSEMPMKPALENKPTVLGDEQRMHTGLVIASLCLRASAALSLIIALAVLASNSQTTYAVGYTISYIPFVMTVASFSSTKYALATTIIGAIYSIYETISMIVRLAMGHPFLPGNVSLFIPYIGDQVVFVLLSSGASAAAACLTGLHDLRVYKDMENYCYYITNWCNQLTGAIAMMFLGFFIHVASLVISSYCFYNRKS